MKKCLIIIDNKFNNNEGLSFSTKEIPYFNSFDKIILLSCFNSVLDEELKQNSKIEFLYCKAPNKKDSLFYSIRLIYNPQFYSEIFKLIKLKSLTLHNIKNLLRFLIMTEYLFSNFKNDLKKLDLNSTYSIVIYSYWMHYHASVGIKIKKMYNESKLITRAHGYDLYEYRSNGYLPLRKYILANVNKVYCISNDGKEYLIKKHTEYKNKICLARLGTNDYGKNKYVTRKSVLKIVSCSNIVEVKRLDRLINALAEIEFPIEWTHIGGGILENKIKNYAKEKLQSNVRFTFTGKLKQEEMFQMYLNNEFHVFINVSESEGLPVSIMEAMSFSIPVVCTNVGGSKEIVENSYNGYLLSETFNNKELLECIRKIKILSDESYLELRNHARSTWENSYNQKKNYIAYSDGLMKL